MSASRHFAESKLLISARFLARLDDERRRTKDEKKDEDEDEDEDDDEESDERKWAKIHPNPSSEDSPPLGSKTSAQSVWDGLLDEKIAFVVGNGEAI